MSPGKVAYDAYWLERDGTDPDHSCYPELTEVQQASWEASAQAVIDTCMGGMS